MDVSIAARVEACFGAPPESMRKIHKSWSAVWEVRLADGRRMAAKVSDATRTEARMLTLLRSRGGLPAPTVHHVDSDVLLMDWVVGGAPMGAPPQIHLADLMAGCHTRGSDAHGLDFDTVIGPLPQPNPRETAWIAFFRDHRLLAQARLAEEEGRISAMDRARLEKLADRLDDLLEPGPPALLHGDLWTGNILADGERIVGLIDPAAYYGHFEVELAFGTLFSSLEDAFFDRYAEHRRLDADWRAGFFGVRRDLYNLYPLLVHARLFGGGYRDRAAQIAARHVG